MSTTPSTLHPKGVNHLAIATRDMKGQLTFWAEVLGCPTRALYWMHGAKNTFHGFVELAGDSYVAFVHTENNPDEIEWGVTHAGSPSAPVTAGTTQHIALHVDDIDELYHMRDRIRSNGVQVLGPIDHGFVQSIYFAGPEGLVLEVACGRDIDGDLWVDPDVQALCDISDAELAALKKPDEFERPTETVPQPADDLSKPRMWFGREENYPKVMGVSDDDAWNNMSDTTPPGLAKN